MTIFEILNRFHLSIHRLLAWEYSIYGRHFQLFDLTIANHDLCFPAQRAIKGWQDAACLKTSHPTILGKQANCPMISSNPYAAPQTESLELLAKHSAGDKKKNSILDWVVAGIFSAAFLAVPIGMAVEATSNDAMDEPYRNWFLNRIPEDSDSTSGPEGFNTNYKIDW